MAWLYSPHLTVCGRAGQVFPNVIMLAVSVLPLTLSFAYKWSLLSTLVRQQPLVRPSLACART
jgi:hypothetical protein